MQFLPRTIYCMIYLFYNECEASTVYTKIAAFKNLSATSSGRKVLHNEFSNPMHATHVHQISKEIITDLLWRYYCILLSLSLLLLLFIMANP